MLPPTQGASPIPTGVQGGGVNSIMAALGLNQGVPTGQSVLPPQMSAGPPQAAAPGALPPAAFTPPIQPGPMGAAPSPMDPFAQMMLGQAQQGPTMGQLGSAVASQVPPPSTLTGPLVPANPTPSAEQASAMEAVVRALIAG